MSKNHSICWLLLWDRKDSIKVFVPKRYFHFNLEMKQNPVLLEKKIKKEVFPVYTSTHYYEEKSDN